MKISKIIRFLGGKELEEDHRVSGFAIVTFLRQLSSIKTSIIVNFFFFFNKNTLAILATKIYKNLVVIFCLCI